MLTSEQLRGLGCVLCAAVLVAGCATGGAREDGLVTWVQVGAGGVASARAITRGGQCPSIVIDAVARPMSVRAEPSEAFPVLVCEQAIPAGTAAASVAGRRLPLAASSPTRIAAIADTGCRLKTGHAFQACNDPDAWPFARIAAAAAVWRPELVIDAGDYLYRELECPAGNAGCAGSPWGSNWAAWDADFFTPAAPLLDAAPWVMVRGDHELCSRGGEGYVRFLDWRPYARCADFAPPWSLPVGDVNLIVMDSVDADDEDPRPERVAAYAEEFQAVARLATANSWLVTHKPLWALRPKAGAGGSVALVPLNPTLQEASGNRLPAGIRRLIVGHIHAFAALGFSDGRAPSFVVGNSGTSLDPQPDKAVEGIPVAGTTVSGGRIVSRFGFTTLERAGGHWITRMRDASGAVVVTCSSDSATLSCKAGS